MSRRCYLHFSLQLGVELNEKVLEQFFVSLFKRLSISVQKALIEAAETDPYAKESTRLIRDMFK